LVDQKSKYLQLAKLHKKYIREGFLPTLGIPFLTLLYESIDSDNKSILIFFEKDNRIIGYVTGSSGMKSIYIELLKRFPRLLISLLPVLLSPKKIFKILEILFISIKSKGYTDLPNEELLTIVVDKDFQGKGYAEDLFIKLCNEFHNKGYNSFKIVVGESLARAHSFYKKLGSIPVRKIEIHKGISSIVYLKKI